MPPAPPLRLLALVPLLLACAGPAQEPPPAAQLPLAEIVRRAIDREITHRRDLSNYTWQEEQIARVSNHPRERKVWDHFSIDGSSYRKLIEKNGRPLDADAARKEQEKMDREIARRRNESAGQRRKRLDEERKERDEAIRFREEVTRAFDFRLEGEEILNGLPAWRIAGTPRPGFRPQSRDGKNLAKIRGRIWIHRETNDWLKFDVETTGKLSFGWFVASVAPGARIISEQMRVNDRFWHPQSVRVQLKARGLWMKFDLDIDQRYRNFRRFETESRIVTGE